MKYRRSTCLLIAAIVGFVYSFYIMWYVVHDNAVAAQSGETAYALGIAMGTVLLLPHMILSVVADMFNIVGWAANSRGLALTGAILYSLAAAEFPLYIPLVLVQLVLSYVGFVRLKGIRLHNKKVMELQTSQ